MTVAEQNTQTVKTVTIKTGEYIGTSELVKYIQQAGIDYGLPRLAKVDHPNKLTPLRDNHGFPDPTFHFSGRDAWLLSVVDRWIGTQREKEIKGVLESTKALSDDQLHRLYEELGKQIGDGRKSS